MLVVPAKLKYKKVSEAVIFLPGGGGETWKEGLGGKAKQENMPGNIRIPTTGYLPG